ncbi:unnamed protein product [Alopecurus aequalis]
MGSRLANVMAVLFLGISLAMIGQLDRVEAGRSYRGRGIIGHANLTSISANATASSLGESKLRLKFCVHSACSDKPVVWANNCYCCLTLPDAPCWDRRDECDDACPICDPDCPPTDPPQLS